MNIFLKITLSLFLLLSFTGCGEDVRNNVTDDNITDGNTTPPQNNRLSYFENNRLFYFEGVPFPHTKTVENRTVYYGITDDNKAKILEFINEVRKLMNLDPLTYSNDVNECAIMMSEGKLSHYPKKEDYFFYTLTGAQQASGSNIGWRSGIITMSQGLMDYVNDIGVASLGHRISILKRRNSIGFGLAHSATTGHCATAALYDSSNDDVNFVAYPYKEFPSYIVSRNAWLSFHSYTKMLANKVIINGEEVESEIISNRNTGGSIIKFKMRHSMEVEKRYDVEVFFRDRTSFKYYFILKEL